MIISDGEECVSPEWIRDDIWVNCPVNKRYRLIEFQEDVAVIDAYDTVRFRKPLVTKVSDTKQDADEQKREQGISNSFFVHFVTSALKLYHNSNDYKEVFFHCFDFH